MKKQKVSITCTAPFGDVHKDKKQWPSLLEMFHQADWMALEAHEGQFRRDNVTPYITHPRAVAESLQDHSYKIIAVLHDTLEDTKLTLHDLKKHFPVWVWHTVDILTHRKEESYLKYILRIQQDDTATIVKRADLQHNMLTAKGNQLAKYQLAMHILREKLPPYVTVRILACPACHKFLDDGSCPKCGQVYVDKVIVKNEPSKQ
jgi:(p)ppGpp synthase/HD superfamily hydrolase